MTEQHKPFVFVFDYDNVPHTAISVGSKRLPDISEIISVHALPFTVDNKVVVVNVRSRGVDVAGGHIEETDATILDALTRELIEEAEMTIKNPRLLDVLEISSSLINEGDRKYIVIYSADIDRLGDFNPNDEISERLALSAEEFSERYFGKTPSYIKHLFASAMR